MIKVHELLFAHNRPRSGLKDSEIVYHDQSKGNIISAVSTFTSVMIAMKISAEKIRQQNLSIILIRSSYKTEQKRCVFDDILRIIFVSFPYINCRYPLELPNHEVILMSIKNIVYGEMTKSCINYYQISPNWVFLEND